MVFRGPNHPAGKGQLRASHPSLEIKCLIHTPLPVSTLHNLAYKSKGQSVTAHGSWMYRFDQKCITLAYSTVIRVRQII